jgi:hypothetical protein
VRSLSLWRVRDRKPSNPSESMIKGKAVPSRPATAIPELKGHLSAKQYQAVVEIVHFASRLQESDLNPHGGVTLRWRVEVAAAFLAAVIDHAKDAACATAKEDGISDFELAFREEGVRETMLDLAVQRAREIVRQGHA